ncbi:MAG: SNF2-related protein, partial [Candidatus Hydrogenedentales bacterium]
TRILDRLSEKSDDLITFEKLGVDALLVDEAHNFKRGDFSTKMERIKGLDTNGSDRSMDFLLKTRWIQTKSPERNVILATGTPISNTLAEMWTMLRYIRPELLKQFGVETFDDFVGTFATAVATIEETPSGGFSQVLRLAKYVNGPEIGEFWRAAADVYVLNREDFKKLGVNVPEIKGGAPTEVVLERPEAVGQFVDFIRDWRAWWDDMDGQDKAEMTWVPIVQYGLARKAAIDLRLINPKWADDPQSKVNRVLQDVFKVWQDTKEITGTQLVFSNIYRSHDPKKRWLNEELHLPNPLYGAEVFNVFEDMRAKLIALGVPENEIANFTEMSEPQRFAAAESVKAGKIRIAFGSTESLGTGLNLQDHVTDIHHVDPQYRPMDFEQRNGRGVRQGNENPQVGVFVYGVKRTLDSTLYQLMLVKQKFIAQMMTADNLSREFEDPADESTLTFQQMSAAFSGNPLYAKRFALENDVRKLSILEEDWARKRGEVRSQLREVQEGAAGFGNTVEVLRRSYAALSAAFEGQEIKRVVFKDQAAEGADAKKLLDSIFTQAFEEMQGNLREEYAAGDLHRANEKAIAEKKRWSSTGPVSIPRRERTRRVFINGVAFTLKAYQGAEIPLEQGKGEMLISEPAGWWELEGHNTADWSADKPWYNSVNQIHGHASSGAGLQTSLWHAIKTMGEKLKTAGDAEKRFGKVGSELKVELEKPFQFGNRLVEQREKLADVLKELEASGASTAAQKPPALDEIVKKFPQFAYLTKQVAAEGTSHLVEQFNKEDRQKAKNSFYIRTGDGFQLVKKASAVKLKGFEWIDAFVWKDKDVFAVSDGATGTRLGAANTEAEAKTATEKRLSEVGDDAVRKAFNRQAISNGLSPRAKARDAENPSIFSKFQEGQVAVADLAGDKKVGVIKQLQTDSGEIAMEIDGKVQVVPARYVEPASTEQQAAWVAEREAAAKEEADAEQPPPEAQASLGGPSAISVTIGGQQATLT